MGKRNLYLKTTPVEKATDIYLHAMEKELVSCKEQIPVEQSLGRITSDAVYASCCSPLFNAAAMDGIGVVAKQTKGASDINPMTLKREIDFVVVDTGDPIQPPYDAVIMAEDLLEIDEDTVQIMNAAPGWQHVRPVGEDIVEGEMLLSNHHKIRPMDIGVLLSGGILTVSVFRRPRVGIIPTGTEIIEPTQVPKKGDILESNSRMFEAMVTTYGGIPDRCSIVKDDYEQIKAAIEQTLQTNDMVLINAGSSAGTEDYTVHILREIGQVLIHGVAIKPGKPVILAMVDHKPVIGLPGYPVSAYIDFENFVKPVMAFYTGEHYGVGNQIKAVLSKRLVSSLKHKEYVRVKVGKVGAKLVASPLARGAGAAMSLVRADGFCVIEQNSEGYEAGEQVTVELYHSMEEIEHTVVAIGSHDLILDILADMLPLQSAGVFLSSTHVGSMGGLMALQRGEAHMAPIHLLDEETGVYNESYIRQLFWDQSMVLIKGVRRIQGIMVQSGNPKNIKGIHDLTKCRYVNRQRGAGTRILLDYQLKKMNINPEHIEGYEKEAATHMAVAALIQGDGADAGMGIYSAAKAMGLDFIVVGEEEYDFAMKETSLNIHEVQVFLQVLRSESFRKRAEELGGYDCTDSGRVIVL
ncbi:MAG: molybdopterin biosynthesis protein [Lachnospiraceae bacterium]